MLLAAARKDRALAAEMLQAFFETARTGEDTDEAFVGALLLEEFRFAVVSFLCPQR